MPPTPPTPPSPGRDASGRAGKRSMVTPALVAMAVVLTLAAYLYWEQSTRPTPVPPPRFDPRALSPSPERGPGGPPIDAFAQGMEAPDMVSVDRLRAMSDPQALLRQWPGDRVLDERESVLGPPEGARNWLGLSRQGTGEAEEMTFCTIDTGAADAARAHYADAAAELGFVRIGRGEATPTSAASVDLYRRTAPPPRSAPGAAPTEQTLLVRLSHRGESVRVMTWLRYAMPTR